MSKEEYKKILEILDKQIFSYRTLLEKSYSQAEAIKDNDIGRIVDLVKEKEELIKSIKELDKNQYSYKNISYEYCEKFSNSIWAKIEEKLDDLYSILNKLAIIEESNQKGIHHRVDNVKEGVKTVQRSQSVYNTYVKKNVGSEAYFFDKKS